MTMLVSRLAAPSVRALAFVGALLFTTVLVAAPASPATPGLHMTATFDGRPLQTVTRSRPLRLVPDKEPLMRVSVVNDGNRAVDVRSVRLDGKALLITFYSFSTKVDLEVAPGGRAEVAFAPDLSDLAGQATGLLPSRLSLLDNRHHVLTSTSFPADVRGSLLSTYGVFGIAVAAMTVLLLVSALIRLATHQLPANRWARAIRFALPGVGLGLTLTFSLSVFRLFAPNPATWLSFVAFGGLVGFGIGWLTPTPDDDDQVVDHLGTGASPRSQAVG